MITESLIDFFFGLLTMLFSGLEIVTLPTDFIGVLGTITCYGVWVVGADVLALFVASVLLWWGVHFSAGIAIWVWDRLPLT